MEWEKKTLSLHWTDVLPCNFGSHIWWHLFGVKDEGALGKSAGTDFLEIPRHLER